MARAVSMRVKAAARIRAELGIRNEEFGVGRERRTPKMKMLER